MFKVLHICLFFLVFKVNIIFRVWCSRSRFMSRVLGLSLGIIFKSFCFTLNMSSNVKVIRF